MKLRMKRLLSMLLVLAVALSLVAPVTALAAGNTVELEVGEKTKLSVSYKYRITNWTSSNSSVATVSSNGTVTAVGPGTATIIATSKNFLGVFKIFGSGYKADRFTVVVTEPVKEPVDEPTEAPVEKPVEDGKLTVKVGQTLQLNLSDKGKGVTWTSSDKTKATVDGNGLVTGVGEGPVTVTAAVKKTTGVFRLFFWRGGKTTITRTNFELIVLPAEPEETVPEETVPEETVPEETVPEETVPEETVPEETVPEETVPEETVPEEPAPDDNVVDITEKLNALMRKNAATMESVQAKRGNTYAALYFYKKVTDGGDWDIKLQDEWKFQEGKTYIYEGKELRMDDPGNIHFGYVGAVVFSEEAVCFGAGMNNLLKFGTGQGSLGSYYDDPQDQEMMRLGHRKYVAEHS